MKKLLCCLLAALNLCFSVPVLSLTASAATYTTITDAFGSRQIKTRVIADSGSRPIEKSCTLLNFDALTESGYYTEGVCFGLAAFSYLMSCNKVNSAAFDLTQRTSKKYSAGYAIDITGGIPKSLLSFTKKDIQRVEDLRCSLLNYRNMIEYQLDGYYTRTKYKNKTYLKFDKSTIPDFDKYFDIYRYSFLEDGYGVGWASRNGKWFEVYYQDIPIFSAKVLRKTALNTKLNITTRKTAALVYYIIALWNTGTIITFNNKPIYEVYYYDKDPRELTSHEHQTLSIIPSIKTEMNKSRAPIVSFWLDKGVDWGRHAVSCIRLLQDVKNSSIYCLECLDSNYPEEYTYFKVDTRNKVYESSEYGTIEFISLESLL